GRRHPDVRDHHVRPLSIDGGEQGIEVDAGSHDLDLGLRLEQSPHTLPDEVVIIGENDPNSHENTIRRGTLVLVVDDNDKNAKLVRDVLQAAGLATLEAGSGEEAIALALEHRPDVILMDIRLPDMDGTDAARRLKAD